MVMKNIPQEEPKQIKCYCGHTITCDCGPLEEPKQETLTYTEAAKKEERIFNSTMMSKQETLEEAALNIIPDRTTAGWIDSFGATERIGFIKGANYQAERMYSEEEVLQIINSFEKLCYNYQSNKDWFPSKKSEWFKQFKKK
jgi:hypothetical protein